MLSIPGYCTCTVYLVTVHVLYTWLLDMYSIPDYCTCTVSLFTGNVRYTWLLDMYGLTVYWKCTVYLVTGHVRYTCLLDGYSIPGYGICTMYLVGVDSVSLPFHIAFKIIVRHCYTELNITLEQTILGIMIELFNN